MKNRVSKRRTRPGGVIARAIRNRLDGSGNRPASEKGFHAPSSTAPVAFAAETEAGFLAGLADRGNRQRARARGGDLRTALQQIGLQRFRDRRRHWNAVVGFIDASAGKDEFAGHEHHLVVALANQDFRHGSAAIDQDQRGGILGAAIGMMIGFFFVPCSFAHLVPPPLARFLLIRDLIYFSDSVRQIHASATPTAFRPRRPSPAAATTMTRSA